MKLLFDLVAYPKVYNSKRLRVHIHILNGDSLKTHFPLAIAGEIIVLRECLIDGNIQGNSMAEFFANRAEFIASYPGCTKQDYEQKSVSEIEKIMNISPSSAVFCWFEDDLFCQCNFWFAIKLLSQRMLKNTISLVRPNKGNEYSFANMSEKELNLALKKAHCFNQDEINVLAKLWPLYQRQDYKKMLALVGGINGNFSYIAQAIDAQIQRQPDASGYGYPQRRLLEIMAQTGVSDFKQVFKIFSKQEGIYSFGDLQVKQMFDDLLKDKRN